VDFVIFSSTCSIFRKDRRTKYINENTPSLPQNHYTLTKYAAERLLESELKTTKIKAVVIRFPSLFGKNHLGGLVHTYYQFSKRGKEIEVFNRGETYRNLLYVRDAVDVLLRAVDNIDRLKPFELFVCGSSDSLKTAEVARLIKDLTASRSKIVLSRNCQSLNQDIFIDLSKTRRTLKFRPLSIREGLKLYVEEMNAAI
jgi:nucleoside-diphosphate-sugar epimerase